MADAVKLSLSTVSSLFLISTISVVQLVSCQQSRSHSHNSGTNNNHNDTDRAADLESNQGSRIMAPGRHIVPSQFETLTQPGLDLPGPFSQNNNNHITSYRHSQHYNSNIPGHRNSDVPSQDLEGSSPLSNMATVPATSPTLYSMPSRLQMMLDRRRDRARRVQTLRQTILRTLGHQPRTPSPLMRQQAIAALSRFQQLHPNWLQERQTDEHCYRAVCSHPDSTNAALWFNQSDSVVRLHFRVPRLNRRGDRTPSQLDQARLKLFVNPVPECPCPEDDQPQTRADRLVVTVHQFIRPLSYRRRNNRVVYRRQILDQVVVPGDGNLWLWLDVKQAVSLWMTRSKKNFGLELTVTDLNGTQLDAKSILGLPSCREGTERSCREDDDRRVHRVLWPTMTLAEDNDPYIDVVTGPNIRNQIFRHARPVQPVAFRSRRSISEAQQNARTRLISKMRRRLSFSRKGLRPGTQGSNSRFIQQTDPHTYRTDKNCYCGPQTVNPTSSSSRKSGFRNPSHHSRNTKRSTKGKSPHSCRDKRIPVKVNVPATSQPTRVSSRPRDRARRLWKVVNRNASRG